MLASYALKHTKNYLHNEFMFFECIFMFLECIFME